MNKKRISENIKTARKRAGLTQKSLAAELGVVDVMISQWEVGLRTPKLENLERIAGVCKISPYDLLNGVFGD